MTNIISIIIPCYNQAQYLDEALQSVLDQTYLNWECIIINDGSPDNTEEVAKKWLEKDNRFKYLCQENGGLSSARNFGISKSAGEFILPLDADDKISSNYVSMAIKAFNKDSNLKIVYCKAEKFGLEKGSWKLPVFSRELLARENMIFSCSVFKKSDWLSVGGYDCEMKYGLEDWEFWIALLKKGGNVKCLDILGFYYRIKPISMITKLNEEKRRYLFEYLSVKHSDFFVEQLGSFMQLNECVLNCEKLIKLDSKKVIIDVFFKKFLGLTLFGTVIKKRL